MPSTLSKRLTKLRKMNNWTQHDLANQIGVQQSTVCRWERDATQPVGLYRTSLDNLFAQKGV